MSSRRQFLATVAGAAVATKNQDAGTMVVDQSSNVPIPPKKYRITLYSGGTAVGTWDNVEDPGFDAAGQGVYFMDSSGKQIQVCGTHLMEEI
jgi:hypothetical protein